MATKVFIGFDAKIDGAEGAVPTTWKNTAKPQGVYTYNYAIAKNPTEYTSTEGPLYVSGYTQQGRHPDSGAWGINGKLTLVEECYLAVDRAVHSIENEVFCTFDLRLIGETSNSPSHYGDVGVTAEAPYVTDIVHGVYPIFRWGQMRVVMITSPEKTAVGATISDYVFTARFSVQNNGTEVAVVTVPDLKTTTWCFVRLWCKLDATNGGIAVTINGIAQSAAYTAQNTVSSISLGSTGSKTTADLIWFGPAMYYANKPSYNPWNFGGLIDNIVICDSDFPAGRAHARRWNTGASSIDVDFYAVGIGASTVPAALRNPTDTKAARGTGVGARTTLSIASGDLEAADSVALMEELLGVDIFVKRPTKRTSDVDIRLRGGLLISSTEYWGTKMVSHVLNLDLTSPPPAVTYPISGLHDGVYTDALTQSNFASSGIMIEVVD